MKVGNSGKLSADLTVASSKPVATCPCCGSENYYLHYQYDDNGIIAGKASVCIDCRDVLCKHCDNGGIA